MRTLRQGVVKLRMAPDTAERHAIVARLAGAPRTVLDVGGVSGQLEPFMPGAQIRSINVSGDADEQFDGDRLPYPDGSFDVVTSLDVLEHIPRPARPRHVAEIARVARDRVVLCCPHGSPAHDAAERDVAAWYTEIAGRPHPFLAEHIELGLPTGDELRELARAAGDGWSATLRFHGDFQVSNAAFRAGVLARHRPAPRRLARYARARVGARPTDLSLSDRPLPHSNRSYLVLDRS